jgi:hypothetical protein
MTTNAITYWKIFDLKIKQIIDPRTELTYHVGWTNPGSKPSLWSGPEPDNYNFAIFDHRPHELKFIKDQVWYKLNQIYRRTKLNGWMSLYYTDDPELHAEIKRSIIRIQPRAFWQHPKPIPMRRKRTMMERENVYKPRSSTNFTTEERLWQLGYYENFKVKYFGDSERFAGSVGTPRGAVLNPYYLNDDMDYTDDDIGVV